MLLFSIFSRQTQQKAIVNCLKRNIGKPYGWGGAGPDRFDCSGLTFYCHKLAGLTIPRTSVLQSQSGLPIDCSEATAADLIFFFNPVSHVATFISNRDVIHSLKKGRPVNISNNIFQNRYWRPKINSCRRYWKTTEAKGDSL
jgi:cell wall-associated NlpC family hydrolase